MAAARRARGNDAEIRYLYHQPRRERLKDNEKADRGLDLRGSLSARVSTPGLNLSSGKKHLTTTRRPTCSFPQLLRFPLISARSVGTHGSSRNSPWRSSRRISIVRMPVSRSQSTGQSALNFKRVGAVSVTVASTSYIKTVRRWR